MTSSLASVHSEDAEYRSFMKRFQARFESNLVLASPALFMTDAEDLFDVYLAAFPAHERQHHTCNACRRFINTYGRLVTIDPNGRATSPMWNESDAPNLYAAPLRAMRERVEGAQVTGVFHTSERTWGQPITGEWAHFSLRPVEAIVHKDRTKTPGQYMAERKEERGMLMRALADYTPEVVEQAVALLKSEALYRSERVLGVAEWFARVQNDQRIHTTSRVVRDQLIWRAVALAPTGFTHVRSSMIGTLLDDIAAGMPVADVQRRFADKMRPDQYQRAQVAPSVGNIEQAERLVAELGLAPSLERRYAHLDEVPRIWTAVAAKEPASSPAPAAASVFGNLKAKGAGTAAPLALDIPAITMTWDKFARTVLPGAQGLEAAVPASPARFMALVTAANPDAPPILQWDRPEDRNPVSWYYASGIDAEMKRRVTAAGGQYDDVDVRASLLWDNRNDLDLHVTTPRGEHIYYANKRSRCGGWLDVDMNIMGETSKPVENIRWAKGTAKPGHYAVAVWNFRHHERVAATPFRLEVEVGGRVFHVEGSIPANVLQQALTMVEFNVGADGKLSGEPTIFGRAAEASGVAGENWGLPIGAFVPVKAIVASPNQWGDRPMDHFGKHTLFVLEGCKDVSQGIGRGFFTETLSADLRPVRATLEAYTAQAAIAGAEEADACGLGMNDATPWDLLLRVKTPTGTQAYKIDRRD